MNKLTAERLREVLTYNPETGAFVWKIGIGKKIRAGVLAGCVCRGRIQICIDGVIYRAHRLAWLYTMGVWPQYGIDHIDGNPSNNAFRNLRDVTQSINVQNQYKPQKRNSTGYLGVGKTKTGKYRSRIFVGGKEVGLGYHVTPELAHSAYLAAKKIYHPESAQ